MNTLFKLILKLFGIHRMASGKLTLVGSLDRPIHVNVGFKPADVSISLSPTHGHHACAHEEDWFSWKETEDGFVFRAKLVSEHREVFWTATK
jgi:hypothetical protein